MKATKGGTAAEYRARVLAIAAASMADPRTVKRELQTPGSVRGLPGDRIRDAIASVKGGAK